MAEQKEGTLFGETYEADEREGLVVKWRSSGCMMRIADGEDELE